MDFDKIRTTPIILCDLIKSIRHGASTYKIIPCENITKCMFIDVCTALRLSIFMLKIYVTNGRTFGMVQGYYYTYTYALPLGRDTG